MLGDRRLFEDIARVASGAAGALGGVKSRFEGELREHVERLLSRMNLVTREEFEVMAGVAQKARSEQEILSERVAALEAKLSPTKSAKAAPAKQKRIRAKVIPPKRQRGAS
jgi:BMFP domain-containing protein YqiC